MRRILMLAWGVLLAAPGLSRALDEPVIGGPCEGCELVFENMPAALETSARIAPVGEPGEPMVLTGIVRTSDGSLAPGIVVYAYQTDATGIYPEAATRHGRLRGWTRTDASGRYRFETIRPGAYPLHDTPQHIHMHVIEPGRGTYYLDDIMFGDDPLLTAAQRKAHDHGRGGSGVRLPVKDADGTWQVERDIVLGANIPGYRR